MVLLVERLGKRGLSGGAGDVTANRRCVRLLLQTGQDFLPDRLVAQVHMMQMDRGGVRRLKLPEAGDRAAEQPEHPAHPLEGVQRRRLGSQGTEDLRVQGVAAPEFVSRLRAGGLRRDPLAGGAP